MTKKEKEIMKIKERFEKAVSEYIFEFCTKQDCEFNGWVGGRIGDVCEFDNYYFMNLDDIRYDIDNQIPAGLIFKWMDTEIEKPEGSGHVNFRSFAMSLPFGDE